MTENVLPVFAADAVAESGVVKAPLRGREVRIMDPLDWPVGVVEKLQDGQITAKFRECLVAEDRPIWDEVDPSSRDLIGLFTALTEAQGASVGESQAS